MRPPAGAAPAPVPAPDASGGAGNGGATERLKRDLRRSTIARRDALPPAARADGSARVCGRLLELLGAVWPGGAGDGTWDGSASGDGAWGEGALAVFHSMGSEVDLRPLLRLLAGAGRMPRLAVPVALGGRRMEFVLAAPEELLDGALLPAFLRHPSRVSADNALAGRVRVPPAGIGFMVMPGVAFDARCGRLGYGGGFYDTYLARPDFAAPTCAVAFDEQVVDGLVPREPHDRTPDALVTPTRLIRAPREGATGMAGAGEQPAPEAR
ncbi:MAG: 5-formyltetrahydrofolate cyclo-ligase [Coriobacteriales bacterium]